MPRQEFEILEMREIQSMLKQLPRRRNKKVMLKGLSDAAKPARSAARAAAPVSKAGATGNKLASRNHPRGTLKKSIGIIRGRGNVPAVYVGPRSKAAFRKGSKTIDAWYAKFAEFGTHWSKRDVMNNKRYRLSPSIIGKRKQPGQFKITRALKNSANTVASSLQRNISKATHTIIQKEAAKRGLLA